MSTLAVHARTGAVLHEKELSDAFTHAEVNGPVIHQCVVAYLANQRRGTASTKTRSEVKGSGRKLYRQEGNGQGPRWACEIADSGAWRCRLRSETTELSAAHPETGAPFGAPQRARRPVPK